MTAALTAWWLIIGGCLMVGPYTTKEACMTVQAEVGDLASACVPVGREQRVLRP